MEELLMQVTLSVEVPNLGAILKEAREKSGKSPTAIAALAEMSVANLYRIESEETKSIPLVTLKRLGDVLAVDFDSVVKEELRKIVAGDR
jgi:transcriptional regulator with XRE-family HTH domain